MKLQNKYNRKVGIIIYALEKTVIFKITSLGGFFEECVRGSA